MTRSVWLDDVTDTVGELSRTSGPVASAVISPGEVLALPSSTLRNLRSFALIRLRSGPLWMLRVTGYRWTVDRLNVVAEYLEAHGDAVPNAILTNRVRDHLGIPNVQIELPEKVDLDGTRWNARPLAVALGLARVFSGGSHAAHSITSADIDVLLKEIRQRLDDALVRFRSGLDRDAFALYQDYGKSSGRIYNYLVTERHRHYRVQFGSVLPVFLHAVAAPHDDALATALRQAIDEGRPLAAVVRRMTGVGPAVFRSLVGLPAGVFGARWLDSPVGLLQLIAVTRPDNRPGSDPAKWEMLNRLVEMAESAMGCKIDQSLLGQMWIRDTLKRGWGVQVAPSRVQSDLQNSSSVEAFRGVLIAMVNASRFEAIHTGEGASAKQAVDVWLLRRSRKQLVVWSVAWQAAFAQAQRDNAALFACIRGARYWPLLPALFVSSGRRRRAVPLVSRQDLVAFGTSMANCLADAQLDEYENACRSGRTFLVGLFDGLTGTPKSVAEFDLHVENGGRVGTITLVQHSSWRNAAPSRACAEAVSELLAHVRENHVQRHIQYGVTALRASRLRGASAVSAMRQETRSHTMRAVLGEKAFAEVCALVESAKT